MVDVDSDSEAEGDEGTPQLTRAATLPTQSSRPSTYPSALSPVGRESSMQPRERGSSKWHDDLRRSSYDVSGDRALTTLVFSPQEGAVRLQAAFRGFSSRVRLKKKVCQVGLLQRANTAAAVVNRHHPHPSA